MRSSCARCSAASAAAPKRSCSRAACRRASTQRMRAPFQAGEFPAPVKYGYASVGEVERGPRELQRPTRVRAAIRIRRATSCRRRRARRCPTACRRQRAVLAANLETAINGLWDARPHVGDRITVVGAGTVGCLVAWLAGADAGLRRRAGRHQPAARADRARARRALRRAGRRVATSADIVIHASGSPAGLELALRVAGFEATIVEMSWYGDQPVPLPLGGAFHARRLTLQVVAGRQRRRRRSARAGTRAGGCSSRCRCSPIRRSTC